MGFTRVLIYIFEAIAISVCFYLITKSQLQDTALMMLSILVGLVFTLLIALYDQCSGCGSGSITNSSAGSNQPSPP